MTEDDGLDPVPRLSRMTRDEQIAALAPRVNIIATQAGELGALSEGLFKEKKIESVFAPIITHMRQVVRDLRKESRALIQALHATIHTVNRTRPLAPVQLQDLQERFIRTERTIQAGAQQADDLNNLLNAVRRNAPLLEVLPHAERYWRARIERQHLYIHMVQNYQSIPRLLDLERELDRSSDKIAEIQQMVSTSIPQLQIEDEITRLHKKIHYLGRSVKKAVDKEKNKD